MGRTDPGKAGSCGMVGERREPLPAEVSVHELDAPHPGGPRVEQGRSANRNGVRPLDRTIRQGRWRVLHGWFQERPPLRDREHDARPRAIWLRGSSGGPRGVRVAGQESGQERRLELFRERPELGLVGGHERVRGVSQGEVDRGHEARRRTRGGVLPGEGAAQARSRIPTVVPVPLPRPLLLRLARRPRFHDRPGIRGGPAIAIRAESSPEEEAAGWSVEPRRAPSGRRGRRGRMDLNERMADEAHAHDLISHGAFWRTGGAMDKKVKKKVLQQIPYGAYIVGTQTEDGKDWLMFGTWLMQTSFKPTLVAFAFRKDSRTLANVRRSKSFAVSFIREGTQDVAELVLDGAFEKVKTERTTSGLPVLSDGAGWIECHVVNQIPEGDHPIVLAEVADVGPGKGKPIFLESLGWHYGG